MAVLGTATDQGRYRQAYGYRVSHVSVRPGGDRAAALVSESGGKRYLLLYSSLGAVPGWSPLFGVFE